MLLKSVDKNIALLILLLNLGRVAIQCINALNLFAALQLLNGLLIKGVKVQQSAYKMKSEKFWDRLANKFDERGKHFEQTTIKAIDKTKKYLTPIC